MKHIKSERLKKLESELNDLEQWLKLGLVPKKDMEKHKDEIRVIQNKIEEEKDRLQFLKESGEAEEYVAPKRPAPRAGYTEMPTIPDIDVGESAAGISETAFDMETDAIDIESSVIEEKEETEDEEAGTHDEEAKEKDDHEEESYFSDRNRWRRGGIIDPDADEW